MFALIAVILFALADLLHLAGVSKWVELCLITGSLFVALHLYASYGYGWRYSRRPPP